MKLGFINLVLKRPFIVLLLGIVAIVGMGSGMGNLFFRGDYKVFFGDNNPQLQEFEQMQRVYAKNDNVSIVIAPQDGEVFAPEVIQLVASITEDAWQTPFSTRVDSLTNYQHTEAEEDDLIVDNLLVDPFDLSDNDLSKADQISHLEPTLVNRIVSDRGHVTQVNITVQLPDLDPVRPDQSKEMNEIVVSIRALVDKYKAMPEYQNIDFYLGGIVMMNASFAEEAQGDAMTLVPAMYLAILIMLVILLRSFFGMIATLVVIIFSIVGTLGLFGNLGFYLSTATVNVPVLVMTLAVADCVHVIASMNYNLRQGMSKVEAIDSALDINIGPIFITSITTAIGFLTFNFSDVPPLRDLGNMVAFGVMLAFVLAVTVLPALLRILPAKVPKVTDELGTMDKFGEWVITNRKVLLPASAIVMIGMTALVPTNKVNDVATEYFNETTEFRQATDFMDENLQGAINIDFSLDTGKPSGINNPEFLKTVDEFANWLRTKDNVDHVLAISDTFKRLNRNMYGDDDAYYKLPEAQDLAAQYLLLYEMSLPYGLDLNNQINIDKSATRLTVTMNNVGSKEITAIETDVRKWVSDNAPELTVTAASPALMFAHIGERNMSSMLIGTSTALILISVLMVVALRSFKYGAISLIPNLAPAGMGFGFWALYSGDINLGLSVVTSMSLGIVVDDSVHFLSKYQRARKLGKTAEDAVRYAFASVGRALWITTLVLFVGFMVLAQSAFALNANLGLLTGIIIVIALIVDFLFLPAFLIAFDKKDYGDVKNENVIETKPSVA